MSDLGTQAARLCVGLTLQESALLAGCLLQPAALRHLQGEGAQAVARAASGAPPDQRQALGRATLERLARSGPVGLGLLHPGWRAQLQGRERPQALDMAQSDASDLQPAQRAAAGYLRLHLEHLAVPMDPRHLQGLVHSPWLELPMLRLASEQDLGALLLHLGTAVLSWATDGATPRERAAIQARLPGTAQATYTAWRPRRHAALARLLAPQTRRAASHPEQGLTQVGLGVLGLAGAHRHRRCMQGLARAMPPTWGRRLSQALDQARLRRAALATEAAALALELLQDLARRGLLEPHWDRRTLCLTPPTEEP
jgi:hypothetical protein